jgi:mediator of RNA polymerase II transcription subunit 21
MDRVTQLQECIDKVSELMYISVGVLQRDAPLVQCSPEHPVTAWTPEQVNKNLEDNKGLISLTKELARTVAADMVGSTIAHTDFLIDSLPGIDNTAEEQLDALRLLEEENRMEGERMRAAILQGEQTNEKIQRTLESIVDDQYKFYSSYLSVACRHIMTSSTKVNSELTQ